MVTLYSSEYCKAFECLAAMYSVFVSAETSIRLANYVINNDINKIKISPTKKRVLKTKALVILYSCSNAFLVLSAYVGFSGVF